MVGEFAVELQKLQVSLLEQPLPASKDGILGEIPHPIPFCADESCHVSSDLDHLKNCYDFVNIKLDKTGGLTEAIKLRSSALKAGFKVMVGCMIATSLSMAPGVILAQGASFVDLDGPLLISNDYKEGLNYDQTGKVHPPDPNFWG